ncbi:MAG: DUF1640 domain-containing protein [Nitrospirae bacterium]|nr:DUF1640 domain-containing protein [Nitrospirota bacterium]
MLKYIWGVWYSKGMSVIAIPRSLREKSGDDGVDGLITVINEVGLGSRLNMATKADLREVKDDNRALRDNMSKLEMKLEVKMESIMAEIEKSKLDSIKWMLAFWASQIGIMIAALKFFIK